MNNRTTRSVTNLKDRIALLKKRIALLEQFSGYGLKQADLSRVTGESKATIANYFAGRCDSDKIDNAVRDMISAQQEAPCA